MKRILLITIMLGTLLSFSFNARSQLRYLTASKTTLTNADTATFHTSALGTYDGLSMVTMFQKNTGTANGCKVDYQFSNDNSAWYTLSTDTILNTTDPIVFGYQTQYTTTAKYYRLRFRTANTITATLTNYTYNTALRPKSQ